MRLGILSEVEGSFVLLLQWLLVSTASGSDRVLLVCYFLGQSPIANRQLPIAYRVSLASGTSDQEILSDYPGLQPEDIQACLAYGAEMTS